MDKIYSIFIRHNKINVELMGTPHIDKHNIITIGLKEIYENRLFKHKYFDNYIHKFSTSIDIYFYTYEKDIDEAIKFGIEQYTIQTLEMNNNLQKHIQNNLIAIETVKAIAKEKYNA